MKLPHPIVLLAGAMILLPSACLYTSFSRSGWLAAAKHLEPGNDEVWVHSRAPTTPSDRAGCYDFRVEDIRGKRHGVICVRRDDQGEPHFKVEYQR